MRVSKASEELMAEFRARDAQRAEQKARDRARDALDGGSGGWRAGQKVFQDMDAAEQARTKNADAVAAAMHGTPSEKAEFDDQGRKFVRIDIPEKRGRQKVYVKVYIPDSPDKIRMMFNEGCDQLGIARFNCFIPALRWVARSHRQPEKDHRITPYHAAVAWAARQEGPEPKEGFAEGVKRVLANLPRDSGV